MAKDPNWTFSRRAGSGTKPRYEKIRNPESLGITIKGWRFGWTVKRQFLEHRVDQLQDVERRLRAQIAELTGKPEEPMSHLTIIAAKENHVPGSGWGEPREQTKPAEPIASPSEEVVVPSTP